MRLAHISDLHLCTRYRKEMTYYIDRLISYAVERNVDHLVIAGDISHTAHYNDFSFLRDILDKYGFLNPQKLSMTIGNHDIFGGVHFAEDIIDFPYISKSLDYTKRVHQYCNFFKESFDNIYRPVENSFFPYAKDLDHIVLIGINSIAYYSIFDNLFASNGRVSNAELEGIRKILQNEKNKNKVKCIVLHHHFMPNRLCYKKYNNKIWNWIENQSMKIYRKNKLLKLFSNYKVDLVLHGHVHNNIEYKMNGIRFLNGGGSLEEKQQGRLFINFIDVDQENINIQIEKIKTIGQESKELNNILYPVRQTVFA